MSEHPHPEERNREMQSPDTQPKQSENEIADYYEGVKKSEMQAHENGIKKARTALFVTAGMLLLAEILNASASGVEWTPLMIGIVAVEVGVFIALGLWTKTKPFTAIVVGLILFILLWVLGIVFVGKEAAYKGILLKAVIIFFLASALKPARAWGRI